MSELIIRYHDGMVDIKHDNIVYGNIRAMYVNGNGSGLQVDIPHDHTDYKLAKVICDDISEKLYELNRILELHKQKPLDQMIEGA